VITKSVPFFDKNKKRFIMDMIYIIKLNPKMWNGLNRIWNTAAIPIRIWWTAVTTSADLLNTFYTFSKEWYEVLANTTTQIKDVLLWAWNHGKWYHKAMNVPLSPVIAVWSAFEWAIRSIVQPIVNWVVNTWNTGVNTVKNARRWSFGRVFSKKPISDFSYNHIKTRPLILNNWFAKLQLEKWETKSNNSSETKTEEDSKEKEKKKDDWWGKEKKEWSEKNKSTENKEDSKEKEKKKDQESSESDKKNDNQNKEDKDKNKKEEKGEKDNKFEEWYKKASEILKDSKHGSKIFENMRTRMTDLEFVFDENSSVGSVKKETNRLTVGMKMPSDEKQIAPLNTKKDNKEQVKHVLLHEMSHIVIDKNLSKAEKALSVSKRIFEKDKTTLTPLAQLWIYKTSGDKAKEDLSEMMALYANKNDDLDKYLSKLTSDKKEDEEYRKKFQLAKISKEDASTIKDTCESLISEYSKGKEIKMDTSLSREESKKAA